jgi:hypothetical protein
MSTLEVIDNRNGGRLIKVKVDPEDLNRLKQYTYIVDKTSERPYREEIIKGSAKRIFLVRDVLNCTYGDGRVIYCKNKDPLDCRRDNLEEGKVRASNLREGKGVFWPHTFNSFLNFLDARKGEDEDLVHLFLSKAIQVKYTYKMIALTYSIEDYAEFQSKKVLVVFKRILHKYFEWSGNISVIKDATPEFKKPQEEVVKENVNPKNQNERPVLLEKVFTDLLYLKEKENKLVEEQCIELTYNSVKKQMLALIAKDSENALKLLKDPQIFLLENILIAAHERMPLALQIGSK